MTNRTSTIAGVQVQRAWKAENEFIMYEHLRSLDHKLVDILKKFSILHSCKYHLQSNVIPVFSSRSCSFCSISARTLSLFSSFCKRLPTSTIAPLYTIRPTFSSTAFDSCFTVGDGNSNLFPKLDQY